MITFRNFHSSSVVIEDESGLKHNLIPGQTLTGSAYLKRFCAPNSSDPLLEVVSDDGSEWSADPVARAANTRAVSKRYSVPAAQALGDKDFTLDIAAVLGGPALSLEIKSSGATAKVRLNENDDIIIYVDSGTTFTLDNFEFAVSTVEIANNDADAATVVDLFASAR